MKWGIIIQARLTSARFPGKIHEMIGSDTMVNMVVAAAKRAYLGDVVVAAPIGQEVSALAPVSFGSENDVASRFWFCANRFGFTHIVRLTADCPLVDPWTILNVADEWMESRHYAGRCNAPDGDDAEAFSIDELAEVCRAGPSEHVTTRMREKHKPSATEMPGIKYSVDTPEDLERVRRMVKRVGVNAGRDAYIKSCKECM